jgi:hypothetical protein
MALDKLKYTYQDPAKVSELNIDDVLNVTNTINTTTVNTSTLNANTVTTGGFSVTGTSALGAITATGMNISGTMVAANGTGSTLRFNQFTANTLNNAPVQIQSGTSAQLPLFIRASNGSTATITAATANGTTSVVYTAVASAFVVGQTVTITGVVSTGNTGATAGTGFNLTNALITAASATSFTATAPANLTDTYTSDGTATIQLTTNLPDIQQWQNPAGTALSKIDAAGNFTKGDGDQIVLASQIF